MKIKGFMFLQGEPKLFETTIQRELEEFAIEIVRQAAEKNKADGFLITVIKEE